MPPCLRVAAVAAAAAAFAAAACGSSTSGGAPGSLAGSSSAVTSAGGASTTGTAPDTSDETTDQQSTGPTAAPVADPCALLPKPTVLAQLHADPASAHVDATSQSVPGGQGCDYSVSGTLDAEVLLALEPASSVDTVDGGFTLAGHPAAYRQTEGGAAEVDVTVGTTSAISVSVTVHNATVTPDVERPEAEQLAGVVVAAYHPS